MPRVLIKEKVVVERAQKDQKDQKEQDNNIIL
jgi:hypothetical protein